MTEPQPKPQPQNRPQRAYRSACPNCGAAVDFRSAASASAVCSYCRSTLVRDGDALRRIGTSAELFDDYSPLQLGSTGRYQGEPFSIVGRLQLAYAGGSWTEWHALFDNGKSGWLSEDNGAFVFSFDLAGEALASAAGDLGVADLGASDRPGTLARPPAEALAALRAGQNLSFSGRPWSVAAVTATHLAAAQGELPLAPQLQGEFLVVELRNAAGEVASLDSSNASVPHTPSPGLHASIGSSVRLAELALQGLRETQEKTLSGRSFDCPSCGAGLAPKLASSLAIACDQCHAVVDLSGADLHHHAQAAAAAQVASPLPLGSVGRLALGTAEAQPWQVVGSFERCDVPEPGDDGEPTYWREMLLYHRSEGFAFLVDAEDGWSWVRPLTGAPSVSGQQARWQDDTYRQQARYRARTTYVEGECYWRVQRDDLCTVTDYVGTGAARHKRLSREVVEVDSAVAGAAAGAGAAPASEVTWSAGEAIDSAVVAKAFDLAPAVSAALHRDHTPLAGGSGAGPDGLRWRTLLVLALVVIVLVLMVSRCSRDDCDTVGQTFGTASLEYQQCLRSRGSGSSTGRSSGGSFGGYSGGGGHK